MAVEGQCGKTGFPADPVQEFVGAGESGQVVDHRCFGDDMEIEGMPPFSVFFWRG